jgi:hypothetical protein
MLINQAATHAAMAHSGHQFRVLAPASRRQIVAVMAEIMEVESGWQSSLNDDLGPVNRTVEVVSPQ